MKLSNYLSDCWPRIICSTFLALDFKEVCVNCSKRFLLSLRVLETSAGRVRKKVKVIVICLSKRNHEQWTYNWIRTFFFFWHLYKIIMVNNLLPNFHIFTPPRNRGGVIFLLQFVCLCVCVCVSVRLLKKCRSDCYTDFDAVFAK